MISHSGECVDAGADSILRSKTLSGRKCSAGSGGKTDAGRFSLPEAVELRSRSVGMAGQQVDFDRGTAGIHRRTGGLISAWFLTIIKLSFKKKRRPGVSV